MTIIALIATVLSVELILGFSAWISHVPVPVDISFVHSVVWHYQRNFQPQRNLFLYGVWLALSIGLYALLCWMTKFGKKRLKWDLTLFLLFHVLIVCLMVHAGFAVVAMENPVWAWPVFWGAFASGVLASIFWPEFLVGTSYAKKYMASLKISPWVGTALGCLFIFLVIFMPDLQAVVAMVYLGDYFHNWEYSLYGAVYALTKGLIPCIDVNITYGFGACVMLAKIVNGMGGFDSAKLLAIAMWVAIIYFVLWFLLMKRFLASTLLAFAAIVCAMRMQMFNTMVDPFIWSEMVASVFRYCFDIGVFWMLWMHIQTRRTLFLALGAFFVSLALFHLLSTGVYIFLVFGLYACVSAFVPCLGGDRNFTIWRNHALAVGSVFVWTVLWFYMSVGTRFFDVTFLKNLTVYNSYYIKGTLEGPLSASLVGTHPLMGIGGLLYPVFYLATFLYATGEVIAGKARGRDIFAGLLAFYGLENHSYYMLMVTEWYTKGLPGIFLIFYWLARALEKVPLSWRKRMAWGLVGISVYCLMTARLFTGYPNLLSFSRNPVVDTRTSFRVGPKHSPYFHQLMVDYPDAIKLQVNSLGEKDEGLKYEKDFKDDEELKSYYARETAWPEDTAMIRRLTPEGGKAAILSSYEILFLQNADRKPFFYDYPLINSRPLTIRNFMVTHLIYYPQIQNVLSQLEAQKPQYIFMERIFLTPQVPQVYFYEYDDLIILLRYVLAKYGPVETGKYLVAMKRK